MVIDLPIRQTDDFSPIFYPPMQSNIFISHLKVNQSLQKAFGMAASPSFSQLSRTLCNSDSTHPEK